MIGCFCLCMQAINIIHYIMPFSASMIDVIYIPYWYLYCKACSFQPNVVRYSNPQTNKSTSFFKLGLLLFKYQATKELGSQKHQQAIGVFQVFKKVSPPGRVTMMYELTNGAFLDCLETLMLSLLSKQFVIMLIDHQSL